MAKQVNFNDIKAGDAIPELLKHPTPRQLVQWAGVSGDFSEIHYDKDHAKEVGLPGIIVHGMLTISFLTQLITDWIADRGTLKKIHTVNRAMIVPNQNITCKGNIKNKYTENRTQYVECEIWAENGKGEKCTTGTALVEIY